ncbi:glycosyltransferase [Microbacterium terregens]|uniref:Glycosyltransferase n=1 Tax=Microbacterium terregens TaxID=69363 RepID=A0ABV5T382_9MICO
MPIHSGAFAKLNRRLLGYTLRAWLRYDGPTLLWAYTPTTYDLESAAKGTVYHCVDLLGEVPGIDGALIDREERRLASKNTLSAAASKVVQAHLTDIGFSDVQLWENVADTATIAAAHPETSTRIPLRVIFAGNLSPAKVDYELLERLARAGLDVRVAGPRAEGGGRDHQLFSSLIDSGVSYLGMLSLDELAAEMVTASVGLIPYRLNEYTRGVSPLKTFEYLAAGLAVVATALPGVSPLAPDIYVTRDSDEFVAETVRLAAAPTNDEIDRRLVVAQSNSWDARSVQVRAYAHAALGAGSKDDHGNQGRTRESR